MYSLKNEQITIERLANGVSSALRVEVAVFDNEARLVYATPTYLRKKGRAVHVPSIQEALSHGNVLVNFPGEMLSCQGCRFKDNCPSTIEILRCIQVQDSIVGVVGLTSFSKEGHTRISQNTEVYLQVINELATLIADLLFVRSSDRPQVDINHYVGGILESAREPTLIANSNGLIIQYNKLAEKAIGFCSISAASLWHLFPEEIVQKVISGNAFYDEEAMLGDVRHKVSCFPVVRDGTLLALVLRLSECPPESSVESAFIKNIIGGGEAAQRVRFLIKKLANSPTPVLITGETGTGKELVARAIHEQSQRRKGPFVAVNCSSVPESLFESELFGYEEGSFTGAKKGGKAGKFELAQGGTLFLDELGDMPMSVQPKLLRVLQDYKVERIGSTEKIPLDIRVVAATNRDLSAMMRQGTFREDLFYRIGVIQIELPPLHQRTNDILPIALDYLGRLHERIKTPLESFSPEVQEAFLRYRWLGNIRELQNVVEYMANLCENEVAVLEDLPSWMRGGDSVRSREPKIVAKADRDELQSLLEKYGHTLEGKKQMAKELGVSLRTLYRRLGQQEQK